MGALAELMGSLSDVAARRGRQFERVCKWYLENEPLFADQLRHVWLWDKWPGRWAADAGIDLVAEDREGRLWAIQAKAYDPNYSVTKHDVDTFLSESSRAQFAVRLLVATTNHIGATARRTFGGQEKPVHILLRADLERSAIEWPASLAQLLPTRPRRKTPRPHQRDAIADVVRGFATADRGQLIMACGTGKTLAALWISEHLQSKRTLVLLPSLSLLAQTVREWTANAQGPFEFLAVCSDETVVGEDAMVARTVELPYPVTTDPNEIAGFLRRRGPRVVFATYQSSPRIAEMYAGSTRAPRFDLAIADEAHRCAGQAESTFGIILASDAIQVRKRLFMTATPRYATKRLKLKAGELDIEVASMDDPELFGAMFHRLAFADAIERDLLSDYQVVVMVIDDDTNRSYAERGVFVTTGDAKIRDARMLASQIGLAKAMRDYGLHRVVSFHSRVDWARSFARTLPEVIEWMPKDERPSGDIWTAHVSGTMPAGDRDVLLDRLRSVGEGNRGLLANARCLAEGVDVPTLDGVAFVDPRRSEVDVVQAVGRAIRKAEGKIVGTIVVPVFVRTNDDAEKSLDSSAFKSVWQVLLALRAHDEVLAAYLDSLRHELGKRGTLRGWPEKIKIVAPTTVGLDFVSALRTRLVDSSTSSLLYIVGRIERYAERVGTGDIDGAAVDDDGYQIGPRVARFRHLYRRSMLRGEIAARLEQIPGWTWDVRESDWKRAYHHLEGYVSAHGSALVKANYVTDDGFPLGTWVWQQRTRRRRGILPDDKVEALEAIIGWEWEPTQTWLPKGLDHLAEYVRTNGNADVPARHRSTDGFALGAFVGKVRRMYRGQGLPEQLVRQLERYDGWRWDPKRDWWERGFAATIEYAKANDGLYGWTRCGIPGVEEFVTNVMQAVREDRLPPDKAALLETIPGWRRDHSSEAWQEGFEHLLAYQAANGHVAPVFGETIEEYAIANWVQRQRQQFKKGTLSADRIKLLESVPGWGWTAADARRTDVLERWAEGFETIARYEAEHGHALPTKDEEWSGFQIGKWTVRQRNLYRTGMLSREQIDRLESVPTWAWNTFDSAWDRGFQHLKQFVAKEGRLPYQRERSPDGYAVGVWVGNQNSKAGKGRLAQERKQLLASTLELIPRRSAWDEGIELVRAFAAREGHATIPGDHVENGFSLGSWVKQQRSARRKGRLSSDQVLLLSEVPGWSWNPSTAS